MNNPYDILGVSQNATDEQVKDAYRELAKKYHPDNYSGSPLQEFADEKMREINTAYDEVMNSRRGGGNSQNTQTNYGGYSNSSSKFADIRSLIQSRRITEAEELLDGIPVAERNAEWYFLKGSVYYSRGWLDDALNHFQSACRMEPNNTEYRSALNRMGNAGRGNFGGYNNGQYRAPVNTGRGCSGCDVCSSLICADCCCECMGGDLISCC